MGYPRTLPSIPLLTVRLWLVLSLIVAPVAPAMSAAGHVCAHEGVGVSMGHGASDPSPVTTMRNHCPKATTTLETAPSDNPASSPDLCDSNACGACGGHCGVATTYSFLGVTPLSGNPAFTTGPTEQTSPQPDLRPPRLLNS